MVDTFESRLRDELQSLRATPVDGERLVAAGHRRARRRTARTTALAAACLAVVAGGVALTSGDGDTHDRTDTTTDIAGEGATGLRPAPDGPSQSPEDARRDGVDPAVAALPLSERMPDGVSISSDEGDWWVSVLDPDAFGTEPCLPADPTTDPPRDEPLCATEYSEVVLVDADGRIAAAVPLPALGAGWLHVTDEYVYAGSVGDGGLPDSALVRIDRATRQATVVVLPYDPATPASEYPRGWLVATPTIAAEGVSLVGVGVGSGFGTPVSSVVGDVRVDLAGVDTLVDGMTGTG